MNKNNNKNNLVGSVSHFLARTTKCERKKYYIIITKRVNKSVYLKCLRLHCSVTT